MRARFNGGSAVAWARQGQPIQHLMTLESTTGTYRLGMTSVGSLPKVIFKQYKAGCKAGSNPIHTALLEGVSEASQ